MKHIRQQKILELIKLNTLATQEDLQEALENLGFNVTQSTVSRDIRELKIVKARDKNGIYRYVSSAENHGNERNGSHFEETFKRAAVSVIYSMNTVIVKCYPGMASSAGVAVDNLFSDIILGSLAGDDTVFAITASEQDSILLTKELKKLI